MNISSLSTKAQVTTAALAVAAAAAITPAVAQAAPTIAPFSQAGLGDSALLLVDSPVIAPAVGSATPGANKVASANASTPSQVVQIFISGFVDAARNATQAGIQYFGTFVYGGLAFTGLAFNAFGLTQIGNQFDAAANNVARAIKIGPYGTSS
jgi:hypothetical protein